MGLQFKEVKDLCACVQKLKINAEVSIWVCIALGTKFYYKNSYSNWFFKWLVQERGTIKIGVLCAPNSQMSLESLSSCFIPCQLILSLILPRHIRLWQDSPD